MIETEEQRRWWFATHPEYSWSRRGIRGGSERETNGDKIDPEEVDKYVDEALKYETGSVADLLKSVKRNFGTEGNSRKANQRLAYLGELQRGSEKKSSSDEEGDQGEATFWDAVAKGIDNTLQDWQQWFGIGGSSTRDLRRNMIKDGKTIPEGHAAHHIVPKDDGRFHEAKEARRILEDFGIDLDSSANGVALPYKPGIGEGEYHPSIHTGEYYKNVVTLLRRATTKEGVLKALKTVENGLRNGTFPK
jgi:A nuclease family of the HNH/ENDO VII superfamily with conserved AHH